MFVFAFVCNVLPFLALRLSFLVRVFRFVFVLFVFVFFFFVLLFVWCVYVVFALCWFAVQCFSCAVLVCVCVCLFLLLCVFVCVCCCCSYDLFVCVLRVFFVCIVVAFVCTLLPLFALILQVHCSFLCFLSFLGGRVFWVRGFRFAFVLFVGVFCFLFVCLF